ncbi:hypothetical protein NIBR502772_06115 [Pseudarthrobacter sp. NIBRBAC000502772]|uniref:hypothetical protein n=1 Tax=Pseudarthrobacter sp. NIBRBAC000502772 TaxID=2590775 RepID=UPI0011328CB2|nr:hypothetical protein [Pseudarthrobacter sp. NIBRBAC000502772]QDG65847.1 hypothetical protein NIBR502772_06115 [Pseudarthrobacter sp. NIBRBAC000502772]
MAIANYSVPVLAGTPPTFAAPATSDTVQVGSTLVVKNASGVSVTVTLVTPGNLPTGDAYPDRAYTVTAGAEAWIPVLSEYRNTAGVAAVTFSAVTSVTAASITHS